MSRCRALSATLLLAALCPAEDPPIQVRIGNLNTIGDITVFIADAKGYFKDVGIKVTIADLASAADAMASLATNQFQVVEGGYSAGYWNALAKNFPIITAFERGSRPTNHKFIISPSNDKIKTIADMKGKSIAVNAPGSLTIYEAGKMLETAGMTIKDVDVKYMPFPQMAIALKNGAVDVADTSKSVTTRCRFVCQRRVIRNPSKS